MARKKKKRRKVYRKARPLKTAAGLAGTAVGLAAVSSMVKHI
jgi:hypothetical protein